MFFWLGSDRSPCMGDTTSCWYINSKLYRHFQQYRWYICSPPTSITRLKLKLGRKPMHRLIALCYTSRTNKISWGSYWLTLTSLWVMAHKAKVWYKGKLNKLSMAQKTSPTLQAGNSLSPYVLTSQRENHICSQWMYSGGWAWRMSQAIFHSDTSCTLLICNSLDWFFSLHFVMHPSSPQWKH